MFELHYSVDLNKLNDDDDNDDVNSTNVEKLSMPITALIKSYCRYKHQYFL